MERSLHDGRPKHQVVEPINTTRLKSTARVFAYQRDQDIVIRIAADGSEVLVRSLPTSVAKAVLALSDNSDTPSHLACACVASCTIWNIEVPALPSTIQPSTRAITALSWARSGLELATASIDGCISLWNIAKPFLPIAICRLEPGTIDCIAWSTSPDSVIAIGSGNALYLWQSRGKPRTIFSCGQANSVAHLEWSKAHPWTLLGACARGRIYVWDLSVLAKAVAGDKEFGSDQIILLSSNRRFKHIKHLSWLGEHRAAVLFEDGRKFAAVDLQSSHFGSVEWELGFSHAYESFQMVAGVERSSVRMFSQTKQRTYPLPGKKVEHILEVESPSERGSVHSHLQESMDVKASSSMLPTRVAKSKQMSSTNNSYAGVLDLLQPVEPMSTVLEVPKLLRAESESPIPFLSPAIPAKKPPANLDVPTKLENIVLPEPDSEGYFGSFSSNTFHDSDSDDDTFGLKESKDTLRRLPGSANVPSPRSCSAVFSRNGELLVSRPPKAQPIGKSSVVLAELEASHCDVEKTSRLFPRFGNLLASTESHLSITPSQHIIFDALGLDGASHNSKESWRPHSLSALPAAQPTLLQSMHVSVQFLDICKEPEIYYGIFTGPDQTGAALCLQNATLASQSCLPDALIWQMLSKVIDEACAPTHWVDHPLGSSWLVRKIFSLAEAQGNVRMLACITAVLIGSVHRDHLVSLGTIVERLPVHSTVEVTMETPRSPSVPRLRTSLSHATSTQQSPIKARTNSAVSSRSPSVPTTPRLESSSSTPPWSFASFSNKTSVPKSISPENSRSSFSAAVKSYAQSVSDKFASYGTSPPVRKGGPSPNNELSSSVPSANGSWTKSVSFASTAMTRRSSTLGNNATDADEDYDSDRTIEDTTTPLRRPSIPTSLTLDWENVDAFSDEANGRARATLLPSDLLPQCVIWTQSYAEQLRYRSLDSRAVEFVKISGVVASMVGVQSDEAEAVAHTAQCCSICECQIEGLEQICSSCQHACHLECLLQILEQIDTVHECPSGCGCVCSLPVGD